MANFIVRIQLVNAKPEDYQELHEKMEMQKFSKTIIDSSDGSVMELPDSEYFHSSNSSCEQIRDKAKSIADSVKSGAIILVSEYTNLCWFLYHKIK